MTTNNTRDEVTRPGLGHRERVNVRTGVDPMSDRSEGTARPHGPAVELTPEFLAAVQAPPYTVSAPCSLNWCRLGAEHDFTGHAMFPEDGVERFHEVTLIGDSPLSVTVSAMERMDSVGVTLETPTVSIEDPDGREFSATEARGLAAALLVAAARLDEIAGGAR